MGMVTVLSPLDHFGGLARLMAGVSVGATPLLYQYSGRHISCSNWVVSFTLKAAALTRGRIQVGAVPGASAQVTVPGCCGPAAAGGILPTPPARLFCGGGVAAVPPQAATAAAATMASAAIFMPGRAIRIIGQLPLLLAVRLPTGAPTACPAPPGLAERKRAPAAARGRNDHKLLSAAQT